VTLQGLPPQPINSSGGGLKNICALVAASAVSLLAAVPGASAAPPTIGKCPVFPAKTQWNLRVDRLPRLPGSTRIVRAIGAKAPIHPDFGSGRWRGGKIGIPFNTVGAGQRHVPVAFDDFKFSDPGPYPLPQPVDVESPVRNPDRHAIVVDRDRCRLYELYNARPQAGGLAWRAGSGATWDLRSGALRPDGWTSADAAGLPMFPLLVRYDEVAAGAIDHALRIAVPKTRKGWVFPARHDSSRLTDPDLPMMGQRLRLKRSVDEMRFPPQARVVVRALKRYGAIVADQGAPWHLTGAPDDRWKMDQVFSIESRLRGRDFEVVDTRRLPR
jgi:hypothetical protein